MKTQILTCIIAILAMLNLTSCNTDCDIPTKVPLKFLNYSVPYHGYDTLLFLYNNTDTQTFIGKGINYFGVIRPSNNDMGCPTEYESLSIEFQNQQNKDVIKLEYVYDETKFSNVKTFNPNVYLRFYFNSKKFGIEPPLRNSNSTIIRGVTYTYVTYFYNPVDTLEYIIYREPTQFLLDGGILKLKIDSNENYELIK